MSNNIHADTANMSGTGQFAAANNATPAQGTFTEDGRFIGLTEKEIAEKLTAEARPFTLGL